MPTVSGPDPVVSDPGPIEPPLGGEPTLPNPLPHPIGRPERYPMPILGRPRPAPITPLDTGGAGGGAGQVQADLAQLAATGTSATRLGADMLSTVRQGTARLAEVGPHAGWAVSDALGRCAAGWQAQLTTTSHAVGAVGTRLANTVANYRDTDAGNATAFRAIGREIQR